MLRKLLLLTMLNGCWRTPSATTPVNLISPDCNIPVFPEFPALEFVECPGDLVCMTPASTQALATYFVTMAREERLIRACEIVVFVNPPGDAGVDVVLP